MRQAVDLTIARPHSGKTICSILNHTELVSFQTLIQKSNFRKQWIALFRKQSESMNLTCLATPQLDLYTEDLPYQTRFLFLFHVLAGAMATIDLLAGMVASPDFDVLELEALKMACTIVMETVKIPYREDWEALVVAISRAIRAKLNDKPVEHFRNLGANDLLHSPQGDLLELDDLTEHPKKVELHYKIPAAKRILAKLLHQRRLTDEGTSCLEIPRIAHRYLEFIYQSLGPVPAFHEYYRY